jgi:YgiT-type zinc finger domain-containing protein
MKCLSCKHGIPEPGITTFTAERDGVIVLVKNVPARICNVCGEEYFDAEVTKKILDQVEDAAKAGGQLNLREFAAA